jgi:hypothetical protein
MTTMQLSAALSGIGTIPGPFVQLRRRIHHWFAHDCLPHWRPFMSPSARPAPLPSAARSPLHPAALERVGEHLTPREHDVLRALATLHVATTEQLARLVFGDEERATAARLARRHVQRLTRFGLARRFVDRSRDRKVGAPGYIHALTTAGLRLTGARYGIGARQRRAYRPSKDFLAHRLAISELAVRLREAEWAGGATVRTFVAEPECWRRYTGPAGEQLVVKPDALVRLVADGTEVSWFVEVDLDTEKRPATIADKCRAYRVYELAGVEQREHGVFPGVMFIVPTEARRRAIARVIARQPADAQELFVVATDDVATAAMSDAEVAS